MLLGALVESGCLTKSPEVQLEVQQNSDHQCGGQELQGTRDLEELLDDFQLAITGSVEEMVREGAKRDSAVVKRRERSQPILVFHP